MSQFSITCDRTPSGLARAAVWQGKTLVDLYIDSLQIPDMTGAVVCGKVVRVLAAQKAAWIDAGLESRLYCEGIAAVRAGDKLIVQIKTTLSQNKAWAGKILRKATDQDFIGVISSPPTVWQRALSDLDKGDKVQLLFAERPDYKAFMSAEIEKHSATFEPKTPVHPDLDEIIDQLVSPVVSLSKGGSLVIEVTQALVAIDVNGGEGSNALAVNLEAVREVARQIRLRNLGGLIVVDCLKTKDRADASKLVNAFMRVAQSDPAAAKAFDVTKLGLLEITRQRRGPSLIDLFQEET